MDMKKEIGLIVTRAFRATGRQLKEDYVRDAVEEKRYGAAAVATFAQSVFDDTLSAVERRLKKGS